MIIEEGNGGGNERNEAIYPPIYLHRIYRLGVVMIFQIMQKLIDKNNFLYKNIIHLSDL